MKVLSWFVLLTVFLCNGCGEKEIASSPRFAIHLLRDTLVTAVDAQKLALDSLAIAPEPFLTEKDIEAYQWSTHSFTAKPHIDSAFARMRGWRGRSYGIPFIMVANNERVYLGAFWWGYSSMLPMLPHIDVILPSPYRIQPEPLGSQTDWREDERIRDALRASGVLAE